ncbi:hypothetical protein HGRIS_014426 [Hohenbuehelia grisea]|uniref:Lysine-specific metallo-endopeptidase domain-containing protein n=1 Tax=Hohenbuehelia grisea TaxID=104357 RepID=A0ABR3JU17_9AGAR
MVNRAIPIATSVIDGAWCYLQKLGEKPKLSGTQQEIYTSIFGTYSEANYLHVYKHFRAKARDFELSGQGVKKNKLTYEAASKDEAMFKDKKGKTTERVSWVRSEGYRVYLGPRFMKATPGEQVRALVHEPMHFRYTADPGSSAGPTPGANSASEENYDTSAIKALAKKSPELAINNADSLTMFAAKVYGLEGCPKTADKATIDSLQKIFK